MINNGVIYVVLPCLMMLDGDYGNLTWEPLSTNFIKFSGDFDGSCWFISMIFAGHESNIHESHTDSAFYWLSTHDFVVFAKFFLSSQFLYILVKAMLPVPGCQAVPGQLRYIQELKVLATPRKPLSPGRVDNSQGTCGMGQHVFVLPSRAIDWIDCFLNILGPFFFCGCTNNNLTYRDTICPGGERRYPERRGGSGGWTWRLQLYRQRLQIHLHYYCILL